jgi:hypothetical protein
MMAKKGFATLLVALALFCIMNFGSMVEVRAVASIPLQKCAPVRGTDKASCDKKKKPCFEDWGVKLKWYVFCAGSLLIYPNSS